MFLWQNHFYYSLIINFLNSPKFYFHLKGSYYALLQSLDFENRIIFHIIYIITIPLSPAWHKRLD